MPSLEVLDLRISPRKAGETLRDDGIHADEVQATIEDVGRLVFWWVEDEDRGRRA